MANVVQLFVYRDPSYISDVFEVGPGRTSGRVIETVLASLGFNERPQALRASEGDVSFAELHVKPANDGDTVSTETFRVVPAACPPRCRRPRACVEVDGVLEDAGAFVRSRLE